MAQQVKMPENLTIGDLLHVIWVDQYEQTGTYHGTERGYLLIKCDDGNISPCFPSHLKEINVIKKAEKPNKNK